jgi:hypothetical protein
MLHRCDWCNRQATHQLAYRRRADHRRANRDACVDHRYQLVLLLPSVGGEITTTSGKPANFDV